MTIPIASLEKMQEIGEKHGVAVIVVAKAGQEFVRPVPRPIKDSFGNQNNPYEHRDIVGPEEVLIELGESGDRSAFWAEVQAAEL